MHLDHARLAEGAREEGGGAAVGVAPRSQDHVEAAGEGAEGRQRREVKGHPHRRADFREIELAHVKRLDPRHRFARGEGRELCGARGLTGEMRQRKVRNSLEHGEIAHRGESSELLPIEGRAERLEAVRKYFGNSENAHDSVRGKDVTRVSRRSTRCGSFMWCKHWEWVAKSAARAASLL